MNTVMKALLERRSVRCYDTTKQVSEKDLFDILKAGAYAPSAMNEQAWHFTAVLNAEKLLALNEAVRAEMGKSDIQRNIERSRDNAYNFYYHAPVLVIVSCRRDALYPREDCACALQNMFLAAESLGLGSCWINQLGDTCNKPAVRAVLSELGVPEESDVYGCAAIGYAEKSSPMKDRASGVVNFVK